MRPIDADILKQQIAEKKNRTVAPQAVIQTLNYVLRTIRRQPTIYDNNACGYWIQEQYDFNGVATPFFICSKCHGKFNWISKHCPDCGSKNTAKNNGGTNV